MGHCSLDSTIGWQLIKRLRNDFKIAYSDCQVLSYRSEDPILDEKPLTSDLPAIHEFLFHSLNCNPQELPLKLVHCETPMLKS